MTSEEGKQVARAAMGWLGTPHVNQAKVKWKGVDCGMLLIASLEDAGLRKSLIRICDLATGFYTSTADA